MDIRLLREQRGWSQEALAEMSGLSARTVQRIERGETASPESLKALAAVFEIPLSEIRTDSALNRPQQDERRKPMLSRDELMAIKEVKALKGFYVHLSVFVAVMVLLLIINLATSPRYLWFLWAAFGWGIGIAAHALCTFRLWPRFTGDWERRQIEKRLAARQRD